MRREVDLGGDIYKFSNWRFDHGDHELPAESGGEKRVIPQEAIFVNKDGTEVGLSPNNPQLQESDDERK